jgi:hypothetical protein
MLSVIFSLDDERSWQAGRGETDENLDADSSVVSYSTLIAR